jgi:hypothetical protein
MRGLVVIAFVLTIFGVACTPHTTSNTDASFDSGPSVSDMGTTTTGLPDQGSSMDGGNPTYANKATLEIAGAGTGSVAIGSAKYSCPQFQPCQWAELNVTGSVLVAAADTGSEFLGWVGPCDPQMIAKNKTQCKVLASATATISKVTAVVYCVGMVDVTGDAGVRRAFAAALRKLKAGAAPLRAPLPRTPGVSAATPGDENR